MSPLRWWEEAGPAPASLTRHPRCERAQGTPRGRQLGNTSASASGNPRLGPGDRGVGGLGVGGSVKAAAGRQGHGATPGTEGGSAFRFSGRRRRSDQNPDPGRGPPAPPTPPPPPVSPGRTPLPHGVVSLSACGAHAHTRTWAQSGVGSVRGVQTRTCQGRSMSRGSRALEQASQHRARRPAGRAGRSPGPRRAPHERSPPGAGSRRGGPRRGQRAVSCPGTAGPHPRRRWRGGVLSPWERGPSSRKAARASG